MSRHTPARGGTISAGTSSAGRTAALPARGAYAQQLQQRYEQYDGESAHHPLQQRQHEYQRQLPGLVIAQQLKGLDYEQIFVHRMAGRRISALLPVPDGSDTVLSSPSSRRFSRILFPCMSNSSKTYPLVTGPLMIILPNEFHILSPASCSGKFTPVGVFVEAMI